MKKLILIGVFLCSIAVVGIAQVKVVPKAGLVIANWKWDDSDIQDEMSSRIGFLIGVGLNVPLSNEALSFNPELYFIQKGSKMDDFFGDDETTASLNYIELPALLRYSFAEGKVFIEAGPSIGFFMGGKMDVDGDGYDFDMKVKKGNFDDWFEDAIESEEEPDDIEIDSGSDFGLQFGAGASLGPVVISIRYGLGLTKIIDSSDFLDAAFTNNTWQFTLGYPISTK